jgi:hypothetical protein
MTISRETALLAAERIMGAMPIPHECNTRGHMEIKWIEYAAMDCFIHARNDVDSAILREAMRAIRNTGILI